MEEDEDKSAVVAAVVEKRADGSVPSVLKHKYKVQSLEVKEQKTKKKGKMMGMKDMMKQ